MIAASGLGPAGFQHRCLPGIESCLSCSNALRSCQPTDSEHRVPCLSSTACRYWGRIAGSVEGLSSSSYLECGVHSLLLGCIAHSPGVEAAS